jgi:hypothetical protein
VHLSRKKNIKVNIISGVVLPDKFECHKCAFKEKPRRKAFHIHNVKKI